MLMSSPYPVVWVPPSPPVAGCPPGLENLLHLDFLMVQQQVEVLEMVAEVETENKYLVKDRWGQILFYAEEESKCCARFCYPNCRPLRMHLTDISQREVMFMDHPGSWFLGDMYVEVPRGNPLGNIQRICGSTPTFYVNDPNSHKVFLIKGPRGYGLCGCCKANVDFKVLTMDGVTEVGVITKTWSGYVQEAYTDADNFNVSFPFDLDVRLKAVLLGACVLIDLVYFESAPDPGH